MEETLCNTAPNTLMTLDEAIQHCVEKGNDCTECGEEHLQLAEWLKELKFFRAWYRKWYAPVVDKTTGKQLIYIDPSKVPTDWNIEEWDKAVKYCKRAVNNN